ncbi:hypothetical protein SAMN04489716_1215 [Actinoplanes derwentensis]|uniref:Uncharacterized protein n=1 Tax=Actinoplanes derwentensis TaxID=113562 RepID=A0A1H1TRD6_9ACTN|nr:hypothetical protein SAMN04489716_1215 [Actinoplanes derwentensis]
MALSPEDQEWLASLTPQTPATPAPPQTPPASMPPKPKPVPKAAPKPAPDPEQAPVPKLTSVPKLGPEADPTTERKSASKPRLGLGTKLELGTKVDPLACDEEATQPTSATASSASVVRSEVSARRSVSTDRTVPVALPPICPKPGTPLPRSGRGVRLLNECGDGPAPVTVSLDVTLNDRARDGHRAMAEEQSYRGDGQEKSHRGMAEEQYRRPLSDHLCIVRTFSRMAWPKTSGHHGSRNADFLLPEAAESQVRTGLLEFVSPVSVKNQSSPYQPTPGKPSARRQPPASPKRGFKEVDRPGRCRRRAKALGYGAVQLPGSTTTRLRDFPVRAGR